MSKVLVLVTLAALMSGCQSYSDKDDPIASMRCWAYRDVESISSDQVTYIRKRSENGDNLCKTLLAGMYENGHGVSQDIAKAKTLYQSVADVNEQAYFYLGKIAESGHDGPPDYVKARQLYQRAIDTTNGPKSTNAETGLAKLMEEGKGGPLDMDGAMALYLGATKASFGDAWEGIQRLCARGVAMTAAQEQRYYSVWSETATGRLERALRMAQYTVSKTYNPGPQGTQVKVQVESVEGSEEPRLLIVSSSGNDVIDLVVLKRLSTYRFPGELVCSEKQAPWKRVGVVQIKGRR